MARGLGDHHAARFRQGLEPCCKGQSGANSGIFPRLRLIEEFTNHDDAGRDADPCSKCLTQSHSCMGDGTNDGESGSHRPLALILMRPWPAEVGEHSVAPVVRDVPSKRLTSPTTAFW